MPYSFPLSMKFQSSARKPDGVNIIEDKVIEGLLSWRNKQHRDERGSFGELVRFHDLTPYLPTPFPIAQMNLSRNTRKQTLRGIHVAAWDKIVFLMSGEAKLVFVDFRVDSPTYGRVSINKVLSHSNTGFYIPAGVGNAYLTLTDDVDYVYLVSILWNPAFEVAISWHDPSLGIDWGVEAPIVSQRDVEAKFIKELIPDFDERVVNARNAR